MNLGEVGKVAWEELEWVREKVWSKYNVFVYEITQDE